VIRCPGVISVWGYTIKNDDVSRWLLIMDYCSQGNLKQALARQVLAEQKRLDIAKAVVKAMKYLHSQRIVHCDLKPANILVCMQRCQPTQIRVVRHVSTPASGRYQPNVLAIVVGRESQSGSSGFRLRQAST
jgi:serine/threonine protein kinase